MGYIQKVLCRKRNNRNACNKQRVRHVDEDQLVAEYLSIYALPAREGGKKKKKFEPDQARVERTTLRWNIPIFELLRLG